MGNDRNIIRWHYVTDRDNRVSGLRGWDSRLEDRYEMTQTKDPLIWTCSVFTGVNEYGDCFYSQVHEGGVLSCMVAAEEVANQRYENSQAEVNR